MIKLKSRKSSILAGSDEICLGKIREKLVGPNTSLRVSRLLGDGSYYALAYQGSPKYRNL